MSLSSSSDPGCHVERVRQLDGELLLVVGPRRVGAACPDCRRRITARHSSYVRRSADNAHVESFNASLGRECRSQHWFTSLTDAQAKVECLARGVQQLQAPQQLGEPPASPLPGWWVLHPRSEPAPKLSLHLDQLRGQDHHPGGRTWLLKQRRVSRQVPEHEHK